MLFNSISKAGEVPVEVDVGEEQKGTIVAGSAKFRLSGLPSSDFPRLPEGDDSFVYEMESQTLKEMLRKTAYAASQDDTRRTLKGVLMSFKDMKLTMVATDGRRLALVEKEMEISKDSERDIVLPSKTVQELQRSLGSDGNVKIMVEKSQVCFEMETIVFFLCTLNLAVVSTSDPGGILTELLAIFLGLLIWLLVFAIEQTPKLVAHSGDMITESINMIRQAFSNLLERIGESTDPSVENWIRDAVSSGLETVSKWGTSAAGYVGSFALNLAAATPYSIIYISFLTIGLYFIAKNYDEIRSYLPGGKRRRQDSRTTQLTNSTLKSLFGYLRVQGTFGLIVWIVVLWRDGAGADDRQRRALYHHEHHSVPAGKRSCRSAAPVPDPRPAAAAPGAGAETDVRFHRHLPAAEPDRHVRGYAVRRDYRPDRRTGADVRAGRCLQRRTVRTYGEGLPSDLCLV